MIPVGSPAIEASAANDAIAPPGTPGVPILKSVLLSNTIASIPKLTGTPQAFAKNTIIKDIRMDTASILIVAPRGKAMEEISLGTSSSSAHLLLIGSVAELEQVPKAFRAAGITVAKK